MTARCSGRQQECTSGRSPVRRFYRPDPADRISGTRPGRRPARTAATSTAGGLDVGNVGGELRHRVFEAADVRPAAMTRAPEGRAAHRA